MFSNSALEILFLFSPLFFDDFRGEFSMPDTATVCDLATVTFADNSGRGFGVFDSLFTTVRSMFRSLALSTTEARKESDCLNSGDGQS